MKFRKSFMSLFMFMLLFVFVGCGSDNGGGDFVTSTPTPTPTSQKTTITGYVVDEPISGATVKLLSLDKEELKNAVTDVNGSYSLTVDESKIANGYILEATGGKMNGVDFNETLRAIYKASDDVSHANITLITSLVAKMAMDDNSTNRSGNILSKRDDALKKLIDMGMVKASDWFTDAPSLVNMDELRATVQADGLDDWLGSMRVDLDDSQLGSDKMRIFSNAHGGLYSVSVSPDKFISLFPGQEKKVALFAEFTDVPDKNITIRKVDGPSWITIDANNTLTIAPASDLTTYGDFTFSVEVLANNVTIGRSENIIVSLVKKVVLVSGTLGAEGGKIENEWKDISISVEAGKLNQDYEIEYNAGLTKENHIVLWTRINPKMSLDEELSLKLQEPSSQIIKQNYLSTTVDINRNINRTVYDTKYFSDGVPDECRPYKRNVPNKDQSEMVWTDENGDDLLFEYVWQGKTALFNTNHVANFIPLSLIGGLPRLWNDNILSVQGDTPILKCASALRSMISENDVDTIKGKDAVLFVHGFINSGKLGGYDHGGGEVGGEYFAKFPYIVKDYKGKDGDKNFIPFVFQWRTNARFQDVADELGRAIKEISEKTGKKVHIVAHSFGGVLVRTLVQNLASSNLYHDDFSEKYIETITTVGTPHSGTFGSPTTVDYFWDGSVDFPEGRHGEGIDVAFSASSSAPAGAGIQNCEAITCYQTGSGSLWRQINNTKSQGVGSPKLYGTMNNVGYITYKTYKKLVVYPEIKTQVLIGLVPESIEANQNIDGTYDISYDFMDDEATTNPGVGDYLISIFGQRIIPDDDQGDLSPMYDEHDYIEEHILPMDGRSNHFTRGMDDNSMVEKYRAGLLTNNRFNINNYRENILINDFKNFAYGYNHRTGQYNSDSKTIIPLSSGQLGMPFRSGTFTRQSEVGLQNCISSKDCNNSTWNYFKSFLDLYPATEIDPPSEIVARGTVEYRGVVDTQLANASINRDVTPVVPFPVTIEAYTGSFRDLVFGGATTTLKADGTYELNVTYSPDTNYTVIAYPQGDTLARIGAKVRASASKFLTTFSTLEESILQFPTITLYDTNYQEGNLTIKVVDGQSATVLNGFDAQITNTTGANVDEGNTNSINSGYVSTQPKGKYTVKISKEGYNDGEAECTINANETTECIVNIVSSSAIANGQITAVLSWGATPSDLDSHLVRKTNGSQDYHVYFPSSARNAVDANLDRDDRSSYGPETITINSVSNDSVYTYYIYNFSGGAGSVLPNSGAKVELNFNGTQRVFTVPNEEGRYWKVFEIDHGRIIPCVSGCVKNDTSTLIRSIDRDASIFRNLPAK